MDQGNMFVYVANSGSMEILVFRMDSESGKLEPAHRISAKDSETRGPSASLPLAVSPDRRFLYAAIRTVPYVVVSFAVDGLSGKLTYLGTAPLPESVAYLCTDRSGRFLLGAAIPESLEKPRASLIFASPIGQHGFAQPPAQIVRTEPKTHSILPDPANKYVLVAARDADCMLRHVFDHVTGTFTGSLPPVRVKPNAGPRHFVFHPNDRYVYVLNEGDATVYVFAYDAHTGSLNELQIESALPPHFVPKEKDDPDAHAADIHITPDGRFLYASVRSSAQTLAIFSVDRASGRLERTGFVATEKGPRSFAIDPCGRYVLVAGQNANNVTSYRIDQATGQLMKITQYATGSKPDWVEIVRLP